MAEPNDWQDVDDWQDVPDSAGEPGHPGGDPYKKPPMNAGVNLGPLHAHPKGNAWDAAKTWANHAALGAGPQVAGVMGAIANSATDPMQIHGSDLDAYRSVRDDTAKELEKSEDTQFGQAAVVPGMLSTPLPIKPLPKGATLGARVARGSGVGFGLGTVSGAATSKGDLTKLDSENWKRVIGDALSGGGGGAVLGGTLGALSRVPAKAGEGAETGAKRLALGSLGMTTKQRGDVAASGQTQKIADALLGDGLDSIPVMGWSRGGTAERTAKRLSEAGAELGGIKSGIDTATGGKTVLPDVLADDLSAAARKYGGGVANPGEAATPEAEAVMRELLSRAERARKFKGGAPMSLSDAEATFKTPLFDISRKAKLATSEPPASATARSLAHDAAAGSNERAAEAAAASLAPDLASKYGPAKQRYATMKELARILQRTEPEAFSKSGLEPLDLPQVELSGGAGGEGITGGARAAIGKALGGVTLPAAAKGLNAFGRFLQKTPTGGKTAGSLAPYLELLGEDDKP